MSAYEDFSTDLTLDAQNGVGLITLNRPKALNALSLEMVQGMRLILTAWAGDPAIRSVIVRGAGGRAFCAGGDIRSAHEAHRRGDEAFIHTLFREEYLLDYLIHTFPKPYIAFMDGIVMGGGCGISVHGKHRIVTERTMLAMPETAIGFFPDIGAAAFLAGCPGRIGLYLGLTGARLGAADILYAGLADDCVPSDRLEHLAEAIIAGTPPEQAIEEHAIAASPSALQNLRPMIDRCFGEDGLDNIIKALTDESHTENEMAASTLKAFAAASPFSLEITNKLLSQNKNISIRESLIIDYRLSRRLIARHDFHEGVRAVLVDKDNRPRWSPDTLAGVQADEIEACFAPLGAEELVLP